MRRKGESLLQILRLSLDVFERLKVFRYPVKKVGSDSCEDFSDVYGKVTSEKDRPSLLLR